MSRPLRLEFAGALYHVTARGDGREAIYLDDEDRKAWLAVFELVCARFNWICHAYCLMGNHYHLLLETPEANLSAGMRQLGGVYTQRFNRRHRRVGHVFQGRYKAIVVERNSYLLELCRYVVLNPVRAGMVADAGDWPWSSYPTMLGKAACPTWLACDGMLRLFGKTRRVAVAQYVDFIRAGVGLPSIWGAVRGQVFLGGDAFLAVMQKVLVDDGDALAEIPRAQRRPMAASLKDYVSVPFATKAQRNHSIRQAWATGDFTLKQIAAAFGVHYATVSRVVCVQAPA